MKKFSIALALLSAMFIAGQACAAGNMSNVSQDINIDGAKIISKPKTAGASGSHGRTSASAEAEYGGGVTIGNIENDGGDMKNISQKISAKNAEITGDGGSITIGSIKNKGK